jgi:hypothetical protein
MRDENDLDFLEYDAVVFDNTPCGQRIADETPDFDEVVLCGCFLEGEWMP